MEQNKINLDIILIQLRNIETLDPEQISQIEQMSDKDKQEIIITMNKVLESLIYVLLS
jgi:hypothetical protein